MRAAGCFFSVLCLGATCAVAQVAEDAWQPEPYSKHYDRHLSHDHVYPDRGAIFREVPKGSTVVNYAGLAYRFHDGVWFEPRGPAFIVVMPPIGLTVPSLPAFATAFESGGQSYLYANDVYYLPRPELGGYQVVNDPADVAPKVAKTAKAAGALSAAAPGAGSSIPGAAPLPADATPADAATPAAAVFPAAVAAGVPVAANGAAAVAPAAAAAHTVAPVAAVSGLSTAASTAAGLAPAIGSESAGLHMAAVKSATSLPSAATGPTESVAAAAGPARAPLAAGAAGGLSIPPTSAIVEHALSASPAAPAAMSAPVAAPPTSVAPVPSVAFAPAATSAAMAGSTAPSAASQTQAPSSFTVTGAVAPSAPTGGVNAPTEAVAASTSSLPPQGAKITATPRNGQTLDQQARDQYECYQFGVAQSGFDPLRTNMPAAVGAMAEFARARAACYESRGYTVR